MIIHGYKTEDETFLEEHLPYPTPPLPLYSYATQPYDPPGAAAHQSQDEGQNGTLLERGSYPFKGRMADQVVERCFNIWNNFIA